MPDAREINIFSQTEAKLAKEILILKESNHERGSFSGPRTGGREGALRS